jgi:hypothetical protein
MKLRQAEYDASWVGRAAVAQEQLGQNAQEIAASGLEDVFSSWAYQGRSLIGVLQGIGQAMVSLLSRAWALKIMGSLFGGGGGGGGGIGTVGEFMSLTPIRRADGGIISGPGTGTSDSIPALVSNGEYIVPAAAVSRPGVFPLLESLRAGVAAPISRAIGALPRFASGGLVTGGGQVSGTMTFGLAEGLTLQHMSGFAGQRVVLETLARNRHAVRQMIK